MSKFIKVRRIPKRAKKIWVVEMWNDSAWSGVSRWLPTVGAALTRADGRKVLREWERKNPDTRFDLRPYVESV